LSPEPCHTNDNSDVDDDDNAEQDGFRIGTIQARSWINTRAEEELEEVILEEGDAFDNVVKDCTD
jgi:hypothetical protein